MSGFKRKKIILCSSSSEEEEEDQKVIAKSPAKSKPKRQPASAKKRKPLVISDESSKDGEDDDDGSISINAIKKQAKTKAKKLMNDSGEESASKKPSRSNNKTPPPQKNTLFNYFKPPTSKKPENGSDSSGSGTKISSYFTSVKEKTTEKKEKVDIGDDFMTTTLVKGKPAVVKVSESSSSKPKESKTKEESKKEKPGKSEKNVKESSTKVKTEVESTKTKPTDVRSSRKEPAKKESTKAKENETKSSKVKAEVESSNTKSPRKEDKSKTSTKEAPKVPTPKKEPPTKPEVSKASKPSTSTTSQPTAISAALPRLIEPKRQSDLWVDKYRPKSTTSIIGCQGPNSPMNKLLRWLRSWHLNIDKKPNFFARGNDDGAGYRAALLSGPPGIGKTTTAQLVCKELGYDYLELNASDVRSKRSLHEDVGDLLANTKLTSFFSAGASSSKTGSKLTAKHCVIMDEVDGMSGNEDRGGVAELIQLIKKSKVPLICICNDRGDAKMRSLVNYCFDLKFPKPNQAQIKGALKSIVFKEKMNIADSVLDELIISSNNDIRQCVHGLSMLAAGQSPSTGRVNEMINASKGARPIKDVKLGPFEAIKKVFATGEAYARMSFEEKTNLFFADYGIMPLFVYENYPSINLSSKEHSTAKQLRRLSAAINAISCGDIVEREVRSNQNWSLLPLQAAYSTVMPGACMRSENGLGMPAFPSWMGKLSTTNKNHRLVDELVAHMRLNITGTRTAFPLDYLQPLKRQLVGPLLSSQGDAISSVLDLLQAYSLTKPNMDSILELAMWSGEEDPMKKVDSKAKAALTRAYNKLDFALPYATDNDFRRVTKRGAKKEAPAKGGKKVKKNSLVVMDEREEEEEVFEEDEAAFEDMVDFY